MAWKAELRKDAFKFLQKQDASIQEKVRSALNLLLDRLDEGKLPANEMDIKRLTGQYKGFLRLRTGKIRIVFRLETNAATVKVYAIDYRGSIYKS